MCTVNFQVFKLVLEKAEEPEIKLPTSAGSWKKQEFQKNLEVGKLPIPKKGNAKECSKHCTIALISHASKVMLKICEASAIRDL